ncbi:MAG TPA: UvrD-helicase domain-containing protein, partial [Candidatus Dormibacteraeota bacterium]|nr:UvrD-helicase domain-containing protein [Candidatus Dormibacteraeota bacterium]
MTAPPVADQAERDRLRDELDRTLFVEAGAGTGKTTAVVSRIVALVAARRLTMERLVAITFTVAAAGELRVRIREELERAARDASGAEAADALHVAAREVERARIETIHAFCSALLRMHPLEARLPPDFETLADLAAAIDVRERFRRWFDDLGPGAPGAGAVQRALLLGLKPGRMLDLFVTLNESWDLVASADWPAPAVSVVAEARSLGAEVTGCIELLPACHTPDALSEGVNAMRIVAARLSAAADEDAALAALVALHTSRRLGTSGNAVNWSPVGGENACRTIKDTLKEVRLRAAAAVQEARAAALGGVASTMRDVVLVYADERRVRGLVSYQDLLVRARDLVRDHDDVRAALRARLDFVAVDEFQDTDPLQAELALRLCAAVDDAASPWHALTPATGRLCVVGDPKQSIYRFRRADIAVYGAVERGLVAGDPRGRVPLSVNFRSGRLIVE